MYIYIYRERERDTLRLGPAVGALVVRLAGEGALHLCLFVLCAYYVFIMCLLCGYYVFIVLLLFMLCFMGVCLLFDQGALHQRLGTSRVG